MELLFQTVRNFCHDIGLNFFIADAEGVVVYPVSEKRKVIHIYNELMKPDQEAFAIKIDDFIGGYLFVMSILSSLEKELLQKHLDELQHRAKERRTHRNGMNRDAFLQNLLFGYLSTDEIVEAADQFRMDKTHAYMQVFIKTIPPLTTENMQLKDIQNIFQHYAEHCVQTHGVMLRSGEAVILLELQKKDDALVDKTKQQLQIAASNILKQIKALQAYKTVSLIVGVSSSAFYLQEFQEGFIFIKDFVRTATKLHHRSRVIFYESHPIYTVLHHISPKEAKEFVSAVFKHIPDTDKKTMETLKMLFKCNLNISQAAEQLKVHRNTLEYRIHKIHQLTHLNPMHMTDAVQFSLAMQLRELYDL